MYIKQKTSSDNKLQSDKRFSVSKLLIHLVLIVFSAICLLPMLLVVSVSFSDEVEVFSNGYKLIPAKFSSMAYEYILGNPSKILNAYMITTIVTIAGTALGLLICSMAAYSISRRDYKYRTVTAFYIFFTMIFNAGLVPWYIFVSKNLSLKNNILVLILPYLVVPWYMMLMKGFLSGIPFSIIESAKIDGGSEFGIFFTIVLPLAKSGLATVGLFYALTYWNDWWLAMLFIQDEKLVPLQFLLARMMNNLDYLNRMMSQINMSIDVSKLPSLSARMAMCIIAAGPMMFVFPFFQKYFIKGLTVGAVKG